MSDEVKVEEVKSVEAELVLSADELAAARKNVKEVPFMDQPENTMSQEDMVRAVQSMRPINHSVKKPLYRQLMSGILNYPTPKVSKIWYNGDLIPMSEWDALTEQQRLDSNNSVRRSKN
jgi:hypothetical protein